MGIGGLIFEDYLGRGKDRFFATNEKGQLDVLKSDLDMPLALDFDGAVVHNSANYAVLHRGTNGFQGFL